MNDRDFLNDLLTTEKYITDGYNTYLNEASHEALYQDVLQLFTEAQNQQRQCIILCSKKAGINLSQQINNNYNKNISNSKGIQLLNFPMVDKTSSNYMKKAALTIKVKRLFYFYFVVIAADMSKFYSSVANI